ncbi:2-dehydro-3-deoxyphosphogluconate aldolase/(4S)-4-hydroxy-2-oxoglutarate aldolase [Paenarthrobacter nicotinovorans]|uniref:bifunctional 4-hydroxy-2-oxoglutarate aldolase/2-dehydro-3-deoxy-phosphogluconate aldolase n=1 Tax=Paenarthrobacter nicotinovorans TaxID=29320 RepID=UPI0027868623|nr:bifunctional 4-hydroxy-2-oxoglutarate aldolase/2-dehydro-3-deoxy-phosphogluconate aldolase [Paenarthrobacter nicotinovorans]MDP9936801.1 2-dehydro-3-deoxyphosphogluconate aldolase/(4S)-4-hydroxy-2-oxoglutarate aldolase [Paenarthrobacter nicotinovorans]
MEIAEFFESHLTPLPLLGIFRGFDPTETTDLCTRAWAEGVKLVEVPVQRPEAMPSLQAAIDAASDNDGLVGAGTVTTLEQLDAVLVAGASFIVSPGLHPQVATECVRRRIPLLPGVATSSEIAAALQLGLTWLKAFPASELGPTWIRAQLAPFPHVKFVATGGIGATNAAEFLDSGCKAVAVGSAFSTVEGIAALRAAMTH